MKKSDLDVGDVVVTVGGDWLMYIERRGFYEGSFIGQGKMYTLGDYDNELNRIDSRYNSLTIQTIYKVKCPMSSIGMVTKRKAENHKYSKAIKRQTKKEMTVKEIEKALGHEVKIVAEKEATIRIGTITGCTIAGVSKINGKLGF